MRRCTRFLPILLAVPLLGWLLASSCASPARVFSTPPPLFSQPFAFVSFPSTLIEERVPSTEGVGEESSGTSDAVPPESFFLYVLNRGGGDGVIDVIRMTDTGRGTLASSIVSIDDPDAVDDFTNEIAIGGFLEEAVIDPALHLAYVLTTSPPALHLIDIETHRKIDFTRVLGQREEERQFLDLPGLPVGIALLPATGIEEAPLSTLYISDQANGDILVLEVSRTEEDVRVSGGVRGARTRDGLEGIIQVGGAPGKIRRLPSPLLPKGHLTSRFFVANHSQRKFTLIEERFPPYPRERIVRDIALPTASRDFVFSDDFLRLFVLPFGAHRVSVFDLAADPILLLRQKITFCALPLSGIVHTDLEAAKDTLFVTTDQNRIIEIDVPREEEPLSGGEARELLLPEVRCNGGAEAGGITLKSQDNIIRTDPLCPVFADFGVHSGPRIDFIILDTCVTPSLDWDFIFDQFVDDAGNVVGSYLVFSRPLGSGVENRRAQPKRLPEISPQQLEENPNGGFYTTSKGELTTRVIFEPSPSGVSNTSDGDHFSFSTFAGFRTLDIGLLPTQIDTDPSDTFGLVVNRGSNSLTIFSLETFDILSEVR